MSMEYTEDAGVGIPVDTDVALWMLKQEMLVPNCIGAYGEKGVILLSRRSANPKPKMITSTTFLGPKLNFVCS